MADMQYSFCCTFPKQRMYRDAQNYLLTIRPMEKKLFVLFHASVWRDSGVRNYPIRLNSAQMFMCYAKSCGIDFGIDFSNSACIGMQ